MSRDIMDQDNENIESENEYAKLTNRKNSQQKYLEEINKSQQKEQKIQKDDEIEEQKNKLDQLLVKAEKYGNYLLTRSKKINERKIKEQDNSLRRQQKIKDEIISESDENENYTRLEQQPSILCDGQLKEFQLLGLNWMISLYESGINGILADEMGLGKTIQSIAMIGFLIQQSVNGPFLVIAPKSTLGNWDKEFSKWLPNLKLVKLIAIKEERENIIKNQLINQQFHVCLTSYEGLNLSLNALSKFKWHLTIIDEAHRLKNDHSLLSRNLRKLHSFFKLLLTGTPLQNNLHELWSLLNFLMPEIFDDGQVFDNSQNITQNSNQQPENNVQNEQQNIQIIKKLHSILRPFMLRRTKKEVDSTIPPKKEIYIYVGLSKVQIEIYKNLLLKKTTGINEEQNKSYYNNLLMQLRKLCNHPYIFDKVEEEGADPMGDHLIKNSGKLIVMDQLLNRLYNDTQSHQILIFSQMTKMLDILEDYCNIRQYQYSRIDGDTDMFSRDHQIHEFTQQPSKKFIFLLSTRAGGLGINLATADTVILYDSDWNPQMDLQAMDRAHRIGQKKQVNVYRFITENTIEEKIIERQIVKLKWDSLVIQSGRQIQNKNLSKEQLKDMIQFGAQEIFKASETGTISEESLNDILQRGEQKINNYKDQIKQQMENIMDLSLNQMDLYQFQNENYLKKKMEDQEIINQKLVEQLDQDFLLRTRREKKIIYNEEEIQQALRNQKIKQKKDIKLNEHQLFKNKERLIHLLTIQQSQKLTEEEEKEKNDLLQQGFINWNKEDYNNFIRGCEKYGKDNIELIQENYLQHKDIDEIKNYSQRFFEELNSFQDKENIMKRIQKGEKQQLEKIQIFNIIDKKCRQYKSVLNELDFQSNSGYKNLKNSFFQLIHDRCILFHTWKQGYGEWDQVCKMVKSEQINRFDSFIRSRNPQDISKRIQKLIKIIQKEQDETNVNHHNLKKNQSIDILKLKADILQQSNHNASLKFQNVSQTISKNIAKKNKKQTTLIDNFLIQQNSNLKQKNIQSAIVKEYENSQKNNSNRKDKNGKRIIDGSLPFPILENNEKDNNNQINMKQNDSNKFDQILEVPQEQI